MRNSKQKLKLLYLIQIFDEYTDEEHGITMSEIIKKLDDNGIKAERKSIYDDIEQLGTVGYEIVTEKLNRETVYKTVTRKFDVSELKKEFRKIYIFDLIKIKTREFNTDFFNAFQTKNVLEIFSIFERNEIECGYNDIPNNLWSIKKNKQNDTMTNEEMLEFFFFTL